MGGEVPKQYLPVGGVPILMRTLQTFHEADEDMDIILVLPKDQQEYWEQLCAEYRFTVPHRLTVGGETRFHSVQNGLSLIPDDAAGVVGVHDGVRPFVDIEVIAGCYDAARLSGAVIPVVPVVETLRQLSDISDAPVTSKTVPRSDYRLVQTPQTFDIQLLKAASRHAIDLSGGSTAVIAKTFTDDASVIEAFGHAITLVEGNRENIKLTTPFDLVVAEALLRSEE
jgi:2-C-methyl-D-erythritol 4-phosphate cytidylyltransferase